MKKIGFLVLAASLVATLFLLTPPVSAEVSEILFVSSVSELNAAISIKDEAIKGLAVSADFYGRSSDGVRAMVRELIGRVLSLRFRPVFVYGQPLDSGLAAKLLGLDIEDFNCDPLVIGGVFPTVYLDNSVATEVNICIACDQALSEENFRQAIRDYWQRIREKSFKEWGVKTLD